MLLHLLLAAPFFAASLATLLPHLADEIVRTSAIYVLEIFVILGALAAAILTHLHNPPTPRPENRT
jgi:hypothetical protein